MNFNSVLNSLRCVYNKMSSIFLLDFLGRLITVLLQHCDASHARTTFTEIKGI